MISIKITADKTLQAISDEFHQHFPYLSLKFFESKHGVGEESDQWDTLNTKLPLSQVGNFDHDEDMSINGHLKVATLEQRFQDLYGIGVQVMRRGPKGWKQTISSEDDLTLSQQNREGEKESADA